MDTRCDGTLGNDLISLGYWLSAARFSIAPARAQSWFIRGARFDVTAAVAGAPSRALAPQGGMQLADQRALDDAHGRGQQYEFRASASDRLALRLLINVYAARPFLLLRVEVENTGGEPVAVHDLAILRAEREHGGEIRFGEDRAPLALFKVGWHGWVYTGLRHADQREVSTRIGRFIDPILFNPALPRPRARGEFWSDGWGILTDRQHALVAGFVSTADQFGVLHVNCSPRAPALALLAQGDGIRLDPGEICRSEWGYIQFVNLPHPDAPSDYVEAVARQTGARVPVQPPAAKWTHWYHHFQNITEDKFIANFDALDRLEGKHPIETVQLDDGYQAAWGDWLTCNDKFPHGLGWLAEQIRSHGYTPGIWLAPFVLDPKSHLAQTHPDWLLRDAQGRAVGAGHIWNFDAQALDTTHPEVLDHLEKLGHTMAQRWGFSFVKTDWCYGAALPGVRRDPKATRAQALRRGLQALRRGLGEATFWLGCGCPFGPAIGLVDAMRIGPDTAPSWNPLVWNMQWASPFLVQERSLSSLRNNLRHTLNLSTLHRRWWWNDPDVVMVRQYGTRLTEEEVKSSLTLVGLHGGLVVNSDDLVELDPERTALIGLITPILSPGARPVDLLEREMPEWYELTIEKPWGRWRVLAVFNWSGRPESRKIQLARLGLPDNRPLHVFDFWNRRCWLHAERELVLHDIPPHGCRLLRLSEADHAPRLVGDTLHVTQGGEIESFEAGEDRLTIRVTDLGHHAQGELWVWLPDAPRGATLNAEPTAVRRVAGGVYALPLELRGAAQVIVALRETERAAG